MLCVTVDTNVLISASIARGNEHDLIELGRKHKARLIISPYILIEYILVLSRPKFKLTESAIEGMLKAVLSATTLVLPRIKLDAVKADPDDNMVLECAVAAKVDYVASGDRHLLTLGSCRKIPIVRTVDVLQQIQIQS